MCGNEPCRHEYGDAINSFVTQTKALVKCEGERDAALATLGRVAAIVADPHAALVADRVRTALESIP